MLEKSYFINRRGLSIATYSSLPDKRATAAVLLIHGYAEHTGRYHRVIRELNDRGYSVYAIDHQGHGLSEGTRADVERFDDYTEDLSDYYSSLKELSDVKSWFVLGHSLGGAIALKFAIRYQDELRGLILTGPLLQLHVTVPRPVEQMIRYLSAIFPQMPLMKLDTEALSRDPDVVRNYRNDPLVYNGRLRARMGLHFRDLASEMPGLFSKVLLPFWAGHGTLDRITNPHGTKMLYERSPSADKTLKMYDGLFHEILNEPERDQVTAEICMWIAKRV
jgi:acylglycerol lipase